jgi:alanyl-tRNA synthetase
MSERLYHSDSFLRTFTGAVTDLREFASGNGELPWQLAVDRTAFYPASGGQPFDTGHLSAHARDGAVLMVPVERVEEDEDGTVWHFVREPLAVGTHVEGCQQLQDVSSHMCFGRHLWP